MGFKGKARITGILPITTFFFLFTGEYSWRANTNIKGMARHSLEKAKRGGTATVFPTHLNLFWVGREPPIFRIPQKHEGEKPPPFFSRRNKVAPGAGQHNKSTVGQPVRDQRVASPRLPKQPR